MTKLEFFKVILETTAEVCNVPVKWIMNGNRKEDVCIARSIVVFWCNTFGFSCLSILTCVGRTGANSIKSIQNNIELYWKTKFAYHIFLKEVGLRLKLYANSIGEDFNVDDVLKHISKITGKYYQNFSEIIK